MPQASSTELSPKAVSAAFPGHTRQEALKRQKSNMFAMPGLVPGIHVLKPAKRP
jgi:hypothetical protein